MLTLRELASKTGKSTGVLDQATKKLIERKIVTKENVNNTTKYAISSLEAVSKWMQKDMEKRHAVLDRKRQDFEAFISTVEHESTRPDMEHFEGLAGIQQAFAKLLEKGEKEWLHFLPATMREEDDPLVEFRVSLFRQRRKEKTFMRSICPNVPLGRRYQTRDVFEYRDTKLVTPQDFPVSFEQFIVGDIVACIDVQEQKASFIRYPELAASQCKMFELLWCKAEEDPESCSTEKVVEVEIPLKTRCISALRECFLNKRASAILAMLAIISLVITGGMYKYTLELMKDEIGTRLMSIAATAAPEIDASDLDFVHIPRDMKRPEYQRVYNQLNDIRDRNEDIIYIYIMRPTEDKDIWEFVVDGDTNFHLPNFLDVNNDGVLNEADEGAPPGTRYDVAFSAPTIRDHGLEKPGYDSDFYSDQWGTFLSANAPIYDESGKPVAILGVDMDVSVVLTSIGKIFKTYILFFAIFGLLATVRLIIVLCKK